MSVNCRLRTLESARAVAERARVAALSPDQAAAELADARDAEHVVRLIRSLSDKTLGELRGKAIQRLHVEYTIIDPKVSEVNTNVG